MKGQAFFAEAPALFVFRTVSSCSHTAGPLLFGNIAEIAAVTGKNLLIRAVISVSILKFFKLSKALFRKMVVQ